MSDQGQSVRNLLRASTGASLATVMTDSGAPYASLVMMTTDSSGRPILLLSDLAVHSQNITGSPDVSLLVTTDPTGTQDPLTTARASIQGTLRKINDPACKARYLRTYPQAQGFAGFADFSFYRLDPKRAHLVAGFGEIHWLDADRFILPFHFLDDIETENEILNHLNDDHAIALDELGWWAGGKQQDSWSAVSIDPEGINLKSGFHYLRILFKNTASTVENVRSELVQMIKIARS
jgi:putative heme iron utilization protein